MSGYYDRQGNPVSLEDWAKVFECDFSAKIVAKTTVGEIEVSTVWLGMDHSFGEGPILIFETMLFGVPGDVDHEYMWRYSTEAQALQHHDQVVAALRDGKRPVELPDFEVPR